jgi:hypothetical protein
MLFDGIEILEGSEVVNFTFPTGPSFPSSPDQGEIFYKTDVKKPYIYIDTAWVEMATGTVASGSAGVTIVPTITGETGSSGDMKFALDVSTLFVHDGTEFIQCFPDASNDEVAAQIYDIALSSPGDVAAGSTLVFFVAPRSFSIPTNFAGSQAKIGTSNGATEFTMYKNGSAAATIAFSSGSLTGTFAAVDNSNLSFAEGDVLSIDSPVDGNPTDLAITFKATV